jgi:hypothetical protein
MPPDAGDNGDVRRTAMLVLVIAIASSACGGGKNRSLHRYYDPQALFSIDLPVDNDETVTPAQPGSEGQPSSLGGVVSAPPQPTQQPIGGIGGQLGQQATPADQTVYEMFVIRTDSFRSVQEMVLFFLTSDPAVDVRQDGPLSVGGMPGRLVVADVVSDEQATNSLAAAFTLGENGRGYLIAALFPPDEWGNERSDFLKVVRSFRSDVPPGVQAAPLAGAA